MLLTTVLHKPTVTAPYWTTNFKQAASALPERQMRELMSKTLNGHSALFDCEVLCYRLLFFFSWLTFCFSPSVSMVLFVFLIKGQDKVRFWTAWHALPFLRKGRRLCLSRYLQFRREYWAILPDPWSFSLSAREPHPKWIMRMGIHFLHYKFL